MLAILHMHMAPYAAANYAGGLFHSLYIALRVDAVSCMLLFALFCLSSFGEGGMQLLV